MDWLALNRLIISYHMSRKLDIFQEILRNVKVNRRVFGLCKASAHCVMLVLLIHYYCQIKEINLYFKYMCHFNEKLRHVSFINIKAFMKNELEKIEGRVSFGLCFSQSETCKGMIRSEMLP